MDPRLLSSEEQALSHAIVQAHHARMGLPVVDAPSKSPHGALESKAFEQAHSVYRAAKVACLVMGFIEPDAECVARAWQAQSERLDECDASLWPHEPVDFGIRLDSAQPHGPAFAPCPHKLGLYAVLPDAVWVARMAQAGVPTVQLRFKSEDAQAIQREVIAAVKAVQGTGALLFINDHWQAAIEAGAYGVHLGQEDLDTAPLEQLRVSGIRLGLSSHGYAEMLRAHAVRPSYLAMGAVFPTTLKRMATAPQGLGRLHAYARLMQHYPLVAIGGIGAEQFAEVLETGVGSIAVVRALVATDLATDQPEVQAQRLMKLMVQR